MSVGSYSRHERWSRLPPWINAGPPSEEMSAEDLNDSPALRPRAHAKPLSSQITISPSREKNSGFSEPFVLAAHFVSRKSWRTEQTTGVVSAEPIESTTSGVSWAAVIAGAAASCALTLLLLGA